MMQLTVFIQGIRSGTDRRGRRPEANKGPRWVFLQMESNRDVVDIRTPRGNRAQPQMWKNALGPSPFRPQLKMDATDCVYTGGFRRNLPEAKHGKSPPDRGRPGQRARQTIHGVPHLPSKAAQHSPTHPGFDGGHGGDCGDIGGAAWSSVIAEPAAAGDRPGFEGPDSGPHSGANKWSNKKLIHWLLHWANA